MNRVSYRELQTVAKALKLPGNMKYHVLWEMVSARRAGNERRVLQLLYEQKRLRFERRMNRKVARTLDDHNQRFAKMSSQCYNSNIPPVSDTNAIAEVASQSTSQRQTAQTNNHQFCTERDYPKELKMGHLLDTNMRLYVIRKEMQELKKLVPQLAVVEPKTTSYNQYQNLQIVPVTRYLQQSTSYQQYETSVMEATYQDGIHGRSNPGQSSYGPTYQHLGDQGGRSNPGHSSYGPTYQHLGDQGGRSHPGHSSYGPTYQHLGDQGGRSNLGHSSYGPTYQPLGDQGGQSNPGHSNYGPTYQQLGDQGGRSNPGHSNYGPTYQHLGDQGGREINPYQIEYLIRPGPSVNYVPPPTVYTGQTSIAHSTMQVHTSESQYSCYSRVLDQVNFEQMPSLTPSQIAGSENFSSYIPSAIVSPNSDTDSADEPSAELGNRIIYGEYSQYDPFIEEVICNEPLPLQPSGPQAHIYQGDQTAVESVEGDNSHSPKLIMEIGAVQPPAQNNIRVEEEEINSTNQDFPNEQRQEIETLVISDDSDPDDSLLTDSSDPFSDGDHLKVDLCDEERSSSPDGELRIVLPDDIDSIPKTPNPTD